MTDALDRGREAFAEQAWRDAYAHLSALEGSLGAEDLERLAIAAYLVGEEGDSTHAWERAHKAFLAIGDPERAVRCAFWLGFHAMQRGDMAQANGWLSRAQRLCEERELDCVERGYLQVPAALMSMGAGDNQAAFAIFEEVGTLAERFGDPDLEAISRLGRGQALVRMGDTSRGVALFDEAMVSVTTDEVSPLVSGTLYCAVIDECQEIIFDVRRAQQWTDALDRWCASRPDMVPYRGQCLVHRSQLMQLHGDWTAAMEEAHRARAHLSQPRHPAIGRAWYQLGELHRLRGGYDDAQEAYGQAHECGRQPHPGLALLWLERGRVDTAEAAIRGAIDDARDPVSRSRLLPAFVEIMLAVDQVVAARAAADELSVIAGRFDASFLRAVASRAEGAVLLAEGDVPSALTKLREAADAWRDLDAPYEAALTRILIASALGALGDDGTAELELATASQTLQRLGASPGVARVEALAARARGSAATGLTGREVEVLRLVAAGRTNRAIAEELVISPKTVERHLSNIFTKLRLSSRAAATAYAYEHDLV